MSARGRSARILQVNHAKANRRAECRRGGHVFVARPACVGRPGTSAGGPGGSQPPVTHGGGEGEVAAGWPERGRCRELGRRAGYRLAADRVVALPEHPADRERLRSRPRLPACGRGISRQPQRHVARLRRRSHHVLRAAHGRHQTRSRRSRDGVEVPDPLHRRPPSAVPCAWRGAWRQRRNRAGVWEQQLRQ